PVPILRPARQPLLFAREFLASSAEADALLRHAPIGTIEAEPTRSCSASSPKKSSPWQRAGYKSISEPKPATAPPVPRQQDRPPGLLSRGLQFGPSRRSHRNGPVLQAGQGLAAHALARCVPPRWPWLRHRL